MVWRKAAHIALGCTLLLAFQLYGVAELIRNEPPRGSVFGVVYSERTLGPIPNAFVRLTREELSTEPQAPTDSPPEAAYRTQGWSAALTPEGVLYPFEYQAWETYTDSQGRFQLRGIPAGVYKVYLSSKVHEWTIEKQQSVHIVVREGERVDADLAMKPVDPFIELIHPQAVYYPDEPLRVGVRGFHYEDTMQLTLYRVRNEDSEQPPLALYDFLSNLRYGWWRRDLTLHQRISELSRFMTPIWEREMPVRGRDPEGVYTQYIEVPRQSEGAYVLLIEAGAVTQAALLSISPIAVVTKSGRGVAEVWCTDLRTGQPIPNAEVRIYGRPYEDQDNKRLTSTIRQFATGRTNAQGLWSARELLNVSLSWGDRLVAVRSPRTGALVYWGRPYIGGYREDTESDVRLDGVLYTERPIYRPGDTIQVKGVVRLGIVPDYRLPPPNLPVEIAVYNPREELVHEARTTLSAMGSFHFAFRTSPEAETGYYLVTAQVGDYTSISQYVPVSAYRKPTYRITVRPDNTLYMPGEVVRAQIHSEYYFGMPVPNTQLFYTVYRREKFVWEDYDETDYVDESDESGGYYDEYESDSSGQVVATGELTTDAAGRAQLRLNANDLLLRREPDEPSYLDETGLTYEYTLEVYALSEGWEGAKGSAQFEIATSLWEARLTPEVQFGDSGRAYRYTVRLTDRRTGRPVQATLRWQAGLYLMAGRRARYDVRAEGTLQTNAQGVAQFEVAPPHSGDWHVRITGRDWDGNPITASHWLWIWGRDYVPWWWERQQQANALDARLQKRLYEPGEQAELALRTPHTDAVFYVTLEGANLYHSQIVKAQGALTRVRLPITRAQIPNAYVSVCMVRNKELIQRVLEVKVGRQYGALQVSIQTDKPRYEPGETLTARIQTADLQGRPTSAEVSLAVVDEAIYSIREDNPQSVYRAFYGRLSNAVYTDFSAVWLALQGDKGSVETIRRDFPDTAFWQPAVMTDALGQATVRLKLPGNLTEWRLTAIGHSRDTKIGFARAKVKASKDLMARLRLPLWLAEGDRTEISAILSNDTDQPRAVQVELRAPDDVRTQTATVPANNSITLRWSYEAKSVGMQKFILIAREQGGRLRDAEERVLEVKPLSTFEVDTRTVLLDGERTLTFTLRPDAQLGRTTLSVESFPGLGAIVVDSLRYLTDYPYECVEQTVSRFVPAVMAQRALKEAGIPMDAETQRKIAEITERSLQRLQRLQTSTGGWGWWESSEPLLWTTAYVVWGLHKAKQAGIAVPESMYENGVDALRELTQRSLQTYPSDLRRATRVGQFSMGMLFPLQVLAEVDSAPPDALYDPTHPFYNWLLDVLKGPPGYWTQQNRFTLIHIFQRWRVLPNAEQHLENLWRLALRDAYEDRSYIDWSPNRTGQPWWYWDGWMPTETQAMALQALLREGASARIGSPRRYQQLLHKTVVALLMGYREDGWYSSRDTALAVEALLGYLPQASKELFAQEAEYEVWLNGQQVQTVTVPPESFWQRRPPPVLRNLPWRAGENTLILRPRRGAPLVSVVLKQARPVSLQDADSPAGPLRLRVYRMERPADMTSLGERLHPLRSGDTVRAGELLRIDVEAHMPQKLPRLDYTVLETPFPAGGAPFDTEAFLQLWWWRYDLEQIRDDRAVSFRSEWTQGDAYHYSLLVRAETPGEYTILPAHLWGMYAPYQAHSNGFRLRIRGD
ncbi:MAG: MG2 domain-containing protein [Fimbriimonadales bacterium]|nr:MG2 domain-containing protein [Fimbriimonadales bacterium]